MKRLSFVLFAALCLFAVASVSAQEGVKYVDATDLTLIGKAAPTPHPYHRADTTLYSALTKGENGLIRYPAGLAVVFKTNSTAITIKTEYISIRNSLNMTYIANAGYALYIKRDGRWLFADAKAHNENNGSVPLKLISTMDSSDKECMLYLPLQSEIGKIEIGVDDNATIEPIDNPFRHRIVFFGSSFTHGISASNPSMSYPMQIERMTGWYIINLGVSGSSKLQPVFADMMAATEADAFVFDAFSNPTDQVIEERLIPFIERIRQSHPTTPLIFVQTIHRENSNFSTSIEERENLKQQAARSMMTKAVKQFNDVYFIDDNSLTGTDNITSADGTHPSDLGYWRWAENLTRQLRPILARYGIE